MCPQTSLHDVLCLIYRLRPVFELHGRQSMPGPFTYFHYIIGPMLLQKTWVQGPPHLFFKPPPPVGAGGGYMFSGRP